MSAEDAALSVTGLRAYYRLGVFGIVRDVRAVDDITFEVRRSEVYGLAGESGSGKSTLVKVLAATARPPLKVLAGSAVYQFRYRRDDITRVTPTDLSEIRWQHLSYVMPGSASALNPVRRVRRSFHDFGFRHMGLDRGAFVDAVKKHLALLNLPPAVLGSYPHELSAGTRQRVAIALATLGAPEFVIADEPTTGLDMVAQNESLAAISGVRRQFGSSFLLVTHDMAVHAAIADRVGIIYAGRLVEEAPAAALFRTPLHPYTRHLVGGSPRPELAGRPPHLVDPPSGCRFHPRCAMAGAQCRGETPRLVDLGGDHRVACFAVGGS